MQAQPRYFDAPLSAHPPNELTFSSPFGVRLKRSYAAGEAHLQGGHKFRTLLRTSANTVHEHFGERGHKKGLGLEC